MCVCDGVVGECVCVCDGVRRGGGRVCHCVCVCVVLLSGRLQSNLLPLNYHCSAFPVLMVDMLVIEFESTLVN